MVRILLLLPVFFFLMCGREKTDNTTMIQTGIWRGELTSDLAVFPFLFEVEKSGERIILTLMNAEERIVIDDAVIRGDSLHIPMYIFDASIHVKIEKDRLHGVYRKDYLDDYVMPFEATFNVRERFPSGQTDLREKFEGKWEVDFITTDGPKKAIGVFDAFGDHMKGTFLTATGDYRFLEGSVIENTMVLSSFDGTHIYLFKAQLQNDGSIEGEYWSGKSWHQKWTAVRNEQFELPDPYALTYLREGYDSFEIKFPNASGDLVELTDSRYNNKIVVLQIMGSWCPNCMDETKFYVDWIKKNPGKNVEFIGLAFERKPDAEYAFERIRRMKEKLGVPYEVLLAGTTSQESRAEALPMLNRIMSFPTSIILDKQHRVRKIHTGFSGPGTGVYYDRFVEEFNLMIDKLVNE